MYLVKIIECCSTLSRSIASACRTSLWAMIFAFIDSPDPGTTASAVCSQQRARQHSKPFTATHTQRSSVPSAAAWKYATVCRAAQR